MIDKKEIDKAKEYMKRFQRGAFEAAKVTSLFLDCDESELLQILI